MKRIPRKKRLTQIAWGRQVLTGFSIGINLLGTYQQRKNEAEMLVAPTTKFGTQKTKKTQKHTTTDMSISNRHAAKAP